MEMSQRSGNGTEMQKMAGGMEYILWLSLIGKSRTTGWYWRKEGPDGESPRVKCCRVDNTLYITSKEIARFWERAEAGEFEGKPAGVCASARRKKK
jgi:hypothetical protein